MVMMRGPYCGPVARPKLALPTVPFTPKLVRLNGLKALARICRRQPVVTFGPYAICLISAMLSTSTGGWRNLLLYCDEVPNANCPGTEKAPR